MEVLKLLIIDIIWWIAYLFVADYGICVVFSVEFRWWIVGKVLVSEADYFTDVGNVLRRCMSINVASTARDARFEM